MLSGDLDNVRGKGRRKYYVRFAIDPKQMDDFLAEQIRKMEETCDKVRTIRRGPLEITIKVK